MISRPRVRRLLPRLVVNIFCPTGSGGGIDPTCSIGGSSVGGAHSSSSTSSSGGVEHGQPIYAGDVKRAKVPKYGYHVTQSEFLGDVHKEGLAPQTPKGGQGKGIYFADRDQYPKNEQHQQTISLRVKIPPKHGAYDDSEYRAEAKVKGDPTKPNTKDLSAFYTTQKIPTSNIEVGVLKDGVKKWVPLDKYLKDKSAVDSKQVKVEKNTPSSTTSGKSKIAQDDPKYSSGPKMATQLRKSLPAGVDPHGGVVDTIRNLNPSGAAGGKIKVTQFILGQPKLVDQLLEHLPKGTTLVKSTKKEDDEAMKNRFEYAKQEKELR